MGHSITYPSEIFQAEPTHPFLPVHVRVLAAFNFCLLSNLFSFSFNFSFDLEVLFLIGSLSNKDE